MTRTRSRCASTSPRLRERRALAGAHLTSRCSRPPRGVVRAPPSSLAATRRGRSRRRRRPLVARRRPSVPPASSPRREAPTGTHAERRRRRALDSVGGRSAPRLAASFAALALAAHPPRARGRPRLGAARARDLRGRPVPRRNQGERRGRGADRRRSHASRSPAIQPSGKSPNNADVYGRVYDGAGSPVTDVSENNRIAYVDEVKPGESEVHVHAAHVESAARRGGTDVEGAESLRIRGEDPPGPDGAGRVTRRGRVRPRAGPGGVRGGEGRDGGDSMIR